MAAAALAKLRIAMFDDPVSLYNFIIANDSPVNSIVEIVTDNNGKYVLYYMVA